MANTIALAKKYVPLLDEVYKLAALTGDLESDTELARAGANTNEIIVPKISMDGLADYRRNSGYVSGDVSLTWETVRFNYERGRKFSVDDMDDEESQNVAFGKLAGEFIRTKVAPELDAFRFATYCGISGISTVEAAALSTGADVIAALRAAVNTMDEDEVPQDQRYLYITPTLHNKVKDLDTDKSRDALAGFARIIDVPQSRFYTAIKLKDGTTSGETGGGYAKASVEYALTSDTSVVTGKTYYTLSGSTYSSVASPSDANLSTYYERTAEAGVNINFLAIHKPAVLQFTKHAVPKIINPDANPNGDAWIYGYRTYGLADVYENKVAGIYLHKSTT